MRRLIIIYINKTSQSIFLVKNFVEVLDLYKDVILTDKMVQIFSLVAEEGYLNKMVADIQPRKEEEHWTRKIKFHLPEIFYDVCMKRKNWYKVSSRLDNGKLGIRIEVQYPNKGYFEAELIDGKPVLWVGERDEFIELLEEWIELF